MARLWAEVGDVDFISTLLIGHVSTSAGNVGNQWGSALIEAVLAQQRGQLKIATESFQRLEHLVSDEDDVEARRWIDDCRLRCAASLQHWAGVDALLPENDEEMWNSPIRDRLLRHKFRSWTNQSAEDGEIRQKLTSFVQGGPE